jgi:N-acetylglucosamine malate deacetylase 1
MKVDILAFGPHPDDVELFCGGTIAKLTSLGYTAVFVDMTNGEMATRGSAKDRKAEAEEAATILGLSGREKLNFPDGGLNSRSESQRHDVVERIRKYKPSMVIGPAAKDRHPDHPQGAQLVDEAVFLANVGGYKSKYERHKVKAHIHYPMWWHPKADFIVDVSETWSKRMDAVKAYKTQFYTPGIDGPKTFLAGEEFIEWVEGRGAQFGAIIGVKRGEPFLLRVPVPVDDPMAILVNGAGEANP